MKEESATNSDMLVEMLSYIRQERDAKKGASKKQGIQDDPRDDKENGLNNKRQSTDYNNVKKTGTELDNIMGDNPNACNQGTASLGTL
jgi:hypothetical protein